MPLRSPFPGMDPYLECRWRDVHTVLVVEAREALNQLLPPDLVARTEDRVYVESESRSRAVHPDVRVSEQRPIELESSAESNVAVAEPRGGEQPLRRLGY